MLRRLIATFLAMALALAGLAPAAAQAPAQAPTAGAEQAGAAVDPGYVLGSGDVIDVALADSTDYKARVTIEPDGTVILPLIGRTPIAGRTPAQARDDIASRLISGGYFRRPEVSVTVASAVSRYATVLGEINTPGLVSLDRPYHLSEIIARAGGVKASGIDTITLTNATGTTRNYSLRLIATAGGPGDPVIQPGDKIFIAPAEIFYIYGQVSNPGVYPIDTGMTVRQALARGGGLTAIGSAKKVVLHRGQQEFKAKLDDKLLPGDTLTVGERFF